MRPDLWTEQKHEEFTEAGHWTDKTLLDYVDEVVGSHPERVAVIDKRGEYTYSELDTNATRLAHGLARLGIGSDDVIAHQIPNRREGIVLNLAALKLGAIVNPIVSIYREGEVGYMLEKLKTKVYVAPTTYRGFNYAEMAVGLKPTLPELDHIITIGGGSNTIAWEDVVSDGESSERLETTPTTPNDLALVQFTSGTTGRPKAAMHTENTLLASQLGQIDWLGLAPDEIVFTPSPIGHLTGIQHGYRLALMLGTTCVLQEQWDAGTALEWIANEQCTYMAGATPFVRDLALHDNLSNYDTRQFERILTAGAPCPREVVRQAHQNFENLTVYRGWGQTENTLPTLNPPNAPEEKLRTTDGNPYGGMKVRIRNPGEVDDALPGEQGELQVKGPFLFLGYYEDEKRTANSFTADEWFKTGDKAIIDEDGFVTIKGRIKDIIIRGGENLPVREIEEYLQEHPKVAENVIVAMPDKRLQERACAYVVPRDAADPLGFEGMVEFLKEKGIATQKLPERLEVVEQLPMTASGKVQRFKLREEIADKLGMQPVVR